MAAPGRISVAAVVFVAAFITNHVVSQGPCTPNPCLNGGLCTVSESTFLCTCPTGFYGANCDNRNICEPNPCVPGAECFHDGFTYICNCLSGSCESPMPCTPNPCMNGGLCNVSESGVSCTCPTGFAGAICDFQNPCAPNPCHNEGFCSVSGSAFLCTCQTGFAGNTCDFPFPGPVQNLRYGNVTDMSLTLDWDPPLNASGQIIRYTVEYQVLARPYQPGFTAADEYIRHETRSAPFVINNLEPSTKYKLGVSPGFQLFTGNPVFLQAYTKPRSDPPSPPPPRAHQGETTATTVTIELARVSSDKYIESYVVQVRKKMSSSVTRREVLIPKYFEDSPDDYIAAEFPKQDVPDTFVVGNNIVYGGYYNAPLQTGAEYNIRVGSVSKGNETEANVGYSDPLTITVQVPVSSGPIIAAIVLGIAVFILVLIIIVICVLRKRNRGTASSSSQEEHGTVELVLPKTPEAIQCENDSVGAEIADSHDYESPACPPYREIEWEDLVIDGPVLGKGNFGEVLSGGVKINGKITTAAIKKLKDNAAEAAAEDFKAELHTMAQIKSHPNVVCLLGACLHNAILYVALEYLPHGNLRDYLRRERPKQQQAGESNDEASLLTSSNLLAFGADVAKGMEHLSDAGIIHRDLAARNILLAEDLTAKVSDFGLSRGEDVYVQKSSTRVPTRWLAIESLTLRTYKTESDVWSFGIVLWEIATYGATPYPGIESKSLVHRLLSGYRMPKPENCSDEVYDLMLKCWKEGPSGRPSFRELHEALERMNNAGGDVYLSPTIYENFVIKPKFDEN